MKRKKVLVTGCEGKIGKILMKGLAPSYDVWGLDRKDTGSANILKADITNYDDLIDAFRKAAPDALLHLAANPHVDANWEELIQPNIIGLHNVYEAAREAGIKKIVYASSNRVTGGYEGHPKRLHEQDSPRMILPTDPVRPDGDYAATKAYGEALARFYADRYGVSSVCMRIGSVQADDDPTDDPRHMKTWLSHRDLVQLVGKAVDADVGCGIYYGVSNNDGRFWDIENAEHDLGYHPQDNAANLKK